MFKRETFSLRENPTGRAAEFVQQSLSEYGLESRALIKGTLISEEAIGSLVSHADREGELRVSVRRFMGGITVEMSAPGSDYSLTDEIAEANITTDDDVGAELQETW